MIIRALEVVCMRRGIHRRLELGESHMRNGVYQIPQQRFAANGNMLDGRTG